MIEQQRRAGRWKRVLVVAVFAIAIGVVLWIWVFPWVDRTYVNRPEVGALRGLYH